MGSRGKAREGRVLGGGETWSFWCQCWATTPQDTRRGDTNNAAASQRKEFYTGDLRQWAVISRSDRSSLCQGEPLLPAASGSRGDGRVCGSAPEKEGDTASVMRAG